MTTDATHVWLLDVSYSSKDETEKCVRCGMTKTDDNAETECKPPHVWDESLDDRGNRWARCKVCGQTNKNADKVCPRTKARAVATSAPDRFAEVTPEEWAKVEAVRREKSPPDPGEAPLACPFCGKPSPGVCSECGFSVELGGHPKPDPINHPSHYTAGRIESIEFIEDQGHGRGFCYGNALKYLTRAPHKGTELEDLKKALWYIQRLVASLEDRTETE